MQLSSTSTQTARARSGRRTALKASRGFTLIELMIVVAIIGILGSLAVSTYQTYIVRAQVAEGLSLGSSLKVAIVDAYLQSGTAPVDRDAAGLSPNATDTSTDYVSAVNIQNGRIEVTFGGPRAHSAIAGQRFSLTPYVSPNANSVAWRCGAAGTPAGTLMTGGENHVGPTVELRYLPAICKP